MVNSWQVWWDRAPRVTLQDLDLALADMVTVYHPHRRLLRAVAETTTYDPRVAEVYNSGLRQVAERLGAYIAAGQTEGVIRPQLDPSTAATWLTVLLSTGLAHLAAAPSDEHDHHLAAAREILWRVLYLPELDRS
jgi:AcrR family transcriptional regulator